MSTAVEAVARKRTAALRDRFALAAMQEFLADASTSAASLETLREKGNAPAVIARLSYRMADAMIAERERKR